MKLYISGGMDLKLIKNYLSTVILIVAMVVGSFIGIVFKEDAMVLEPLGTLFLNMLLVIIVPLIFVTITTSIARMNQPKRLGKIAKGIVSVFIITSLVSVFVGVGASYTTNLVSSEYGNALKQEMDFTVEGESSVSILDKTVELISVDDFSKLLTKDHIIAIVVMAVVIGVAMNLCGESVYPLLHVLNALNEVILKLIKLIMYYAPIGIGCYFAATVSKFGSSIAVGYFKTFMVYTITCIVLYVVVYTLYAYIAGGKNGVRLFYKHSIAPMLTSIATCSSAACIPVNIEASKNIGVSHDIAETTIPLGTSFHKDGSIIGSVFKIMFLVYLFDTNVSLIQIISISLVANLLVTAVPIGGGSISEMLIITMLGFPIASLPLLTMVATVIDAPATMLNVVGDTSSSMLVSRFVDGKDWITQK